ncbi:MAG TPA: SDR family oxidoreductase, partial [Tepidisphaeraceae bacterium]|nr:SDR family oxidoreductase [Tepidisphaeraceae bacterium]
KREDIEHIISVARDRFGGFDTWVNNAGVSIFGRLDEVSEQDHRQLFEVNFWGLVNGSLLALETLRTRGGALINLGSEVSDLAIPMQGMYCASKHAIKGFTDALRLEMEAAKLPVSITLIKPAGINTPYPQHARNYMDEEPTLPPPVYAPEEVANAICHAAEHPVRDVYVGGGSKLMSSLNKHVPRLVDWVTERGMISQQKSGKPPRNPMGALYHAGGGARAHGDYEGHVMKRSLY